MRATARVATLLALLLAACGGSKSTTTPPPPPGGSGTFQLAGTVTEQGSASSGSTSPLPGAEVRISVDRNANGAIDAGESVTTTTGADGKYTLSFTVNEGETAVVRISKSGLSSAVRTLKVAPSASVPYSATLRGLDNLTSQNGVLTNQTGSVSLAGLPAGASGSARVFNPVTETDAFPGDFSDSAGNRLISGVFGSFELKDGSNNKLETLTAAATLKMQMPRDTWASIVDITTGNAQIDVPLYSFKEASGEWVRDGAGWLEDGSGAKIPPSALASLRDGSYVGAVFAVGEVTHFSSWNVDWPVASHGCVKGRVVDAAGTSPVAGATVTATGVTYTGTSRPVTVGADGTFCIEVMRSEGTGEDVNGNGVNGEVSKILIRVVSGGQLYNFDTRDMPTANATCGGAGCLDVGDLALTADRKLSPKLCSVSGTVYQRDGTTPAAGATVMAWDDSVPSEVVDTLCFNGQTLLCTIFATAGADGSFTFATPSLGAVNLWGMMNTEVSPGVSEVAYGQRMLGDCPAAPVTFRLDSGYTSITATVSVAAGTISWTPLSYGATLVYVTAAGGTSSSFKWMISVPEGQVISSPVTYGTVPAGATQVFPTSGAPAALGTGDMVTVFLSGKAADGFPYFGSGTGLVP